MRSARWGFFGGIAVLCVALRVVNAPVSAGFVAAMAFPFEQIASALRALSLSGVAGNAVALCGYVALSLSPVIALLVVSARRPLRAEDGLLALLSAVLFAVLYGMVNPGDLGAMMGQATGAALSIGKAMAGGLAYSVLLGYLVLRALRQSALGGYDRLARTLKAMLMLLGAVFVYQVFGASLGALVDGIAALRAGNAGYEHLLSVSYAFLGLKYAVAALPYALDVWVVLAATALLDALKAGSDRADAVNAANRLSRRGAIAVAATVLTGICFNLAQCLFATRLTDVHISVDIPLVAIAFALTALLLSRLVAENARLQDDNDSII